MKANSLTDKKEALKEIVTMVEELKLLVRLCKETKALITNICKQAQLLSKLLNLKLIYCKNSWWRFNIGFPVHKLCRYIQKIINLGIHAAVIKQIKHSYVCFRSLNIVYVINK